jgi:hypothetical protein
VLLHRVSREVVEGMPVSREPELVRGVYRPAGDWRAWQHETIGGHAAPSRSRVHAAIPV